MSIIRRHKNLHVLGDLTQISCDVHSKSMKIKLSWGHLDTGFVWCPISEITKIFMSLEIWHRFRVMSTRNQKNQITILGYFDTDFVWCQISEITKFFMSLGIWHRFRVMSTRNQKIKMLFWSFWHRFRVMSNIWNHKNFHFLGDLTQISCDVHPESKKLKLLLGSFWQRFRVMCTRNHENLKMNYDSGPFWHRFRFVSNIWDHKNYYFLGDFTQISCEVHLKLKKLNYDSG